jgi:hypothetical protein
VRTTPTPPKADPPEGEAAPATPDAAALNESWRAEPRAPRGIAGVLFRFLDRLLGPRFEAQQEFNAQQVRLDNDLLRHLEERLAATHRHYDEVLGLYGRHLEEIDERHALLEKELVTHVEDLVRRVDLVLDGAERGRLSLEHELRDVRRRLEELRNALGRS